MINCLFLQDFMDMFHNTKSSREKGTLANIRVCYGHKNVLHNTKKCFNATFELIDFVTTSYIIALALKFLGVNNMKEVPKVLPKMKEDKLLYLHMIAEKVANEGFVTSNNDDIMSTTDDDDNDFPWCICKENCGGTMIFCDNALCPKGEWFHVDCLDLNEEVR